MTCHPTKCSEIVECYVEHSASLKDLTNAGFDPAVVTDVLRRIDEAEITRRYTPPGIKVTSRAFDQDRRMPLTSSWRPLTVISPGTSALGRLPISRKSASIRQ